MVEKVRNVRKKIIKLLLTGEWIKILEKERNELDEVKVVT